MGQPSEFGLWRRGHRDRLHAGDLRRDDIHDHARGQWRETTWDIEADAADRDVPEPHRCVGAQFRSGGIGVKLEHLCDLAAALDRDLEPDLLAHLAAQIERPACLVLDYEANCVSTELFRETLPQFIAIYRQYHPDVPILVISRLRRVHDEIYPDSLARRTERWELQRGTVEARRKAGDRNIYFLDGTTLLKSDWDECTVDTTHPNDIGFLQMADGIEPVLRVILGL